MLVEYFQAQSSASEMSIHEQIANQRSLIRGIEEGIEYDSHGPAGPESSPSRFPDRHII